MESSTKDQGADAFGRFKSSEIFAYLRDGQYPEDFSKAEKGSLRKRAKFFFVKDAELFYKSASKSGLSII